MTWRKRIGLALGLLSVVVLAAGLTMYLNSTNGKVAGKSASLVAEDYPVGTDYSGTITEQYVHTGDQVRRATPVRRAVRRPGTRPGPGPCQQGQPHPRSEERQHPGHHRHQRRPDRHPVLRQGRLRPRELHHRHRPASRLHVRRSRLPAHRQGLRPRPRPGHPGHHPAQQPEHHRPGLPNQGLHRKRRSPHHRQGLQPRPGQRHRPVRRRHPRPSHPPPHQRRTHHRHHHHRHRLVRSRRMTGARTTSSGSYDSNPSDREDTVTTKSTGSPKVWSKLAKPLTLIAGVALVAGCTSNTSDSTSSSAESSTGVVANPASAPQITADLAAITHKTVAKIAPTRLADGLV